MAEQGAGDELPAGEYQVMDAVDFLRDVLGVGAPVPAKEQPTEASMDEQEAPAPDAVWPMKGGPLRLKLVCSSRAAQMMVLYDMDSGRHLECANVDIHFHAKEYVTATVECLIEAVEYAAEEQA